LGVGRWTNNPAPQKRLLLRNPKRGSQGPIWAVEPDDDDDDDDDDDRLKHFEASE
jgi:hypothetical protein